MFFRRTKNGIICYCTAKHGICQAFLSREVIKQPKKLYNSSAITISEDRSVQNGGTEGLFEKHGYNVRGDVHIKGTGRCAENTSRQYHRRRGHGLLYDGVQYLHPRARLCLLGYTDDTYKHRGGAEFAGQGQGDSGSQALLSAAFGDTGACGYGARIYSRSTLCMLYRKFPREPSGSAVHSAVGIVLLRYGGVQGLLRGAVRHAPYGGFAGDRGGGEGGSGYRAVLLRIL